MISRIITRILVSLGQLLPKSYLQSTGNRIRYAGLSFSPQVWLGSAILAGLAISPVFGVLSFFYFIANIFSVVIVSTFVFILIQLIFYVILIFIGDSRTRQIEEILPDALLLISANIRAGLTPDRAIWLAARPEFGLFENELRQVGKETFAGEPLQESLQKLTTRLESSILERTIQLITEGLRAGGELAELLEQVAKDIRTSQLLRKETAASVMMYTIFIVFASLIGAPLLFAISTFFIKMMMSMGGAVTGTGLTAESAQVLGAGVAGSVSALGFGEDVCPPFLVDCEPVAFLTTYAIACIAVITFFGSLMIGTIQSGKAVQGLKFAPVFCTIGIVIFFAIKSLVAMFFSTMI